AWLRKGSLICQDKFQNKTKKQNWSRMSKRYGSKHGSRTCAEPWLKEP
ncbi:mCG145196, partial [Mus musculus]